MTNTFTEQLQKLETENGFIAALDQSGGSTPKALRQYGIGDDSYSGEDEMFDRIHGMRTRIMTSPSFDGDRILGAILFEDTMNRTIAGKGTTQYLWENKRVVPFLKVDRGLATEQHGAQLMKPIPNLRKLLEHAKNNNVFGTKMRSVIRTANADGVREVVAQQFEFARRISTTGLVPILEPEVLIDSPQKAAAEILLKTHVIENLNTLSTHHKLILKLTLPTEDNFYADCIGHPNVLRVAALSGGYSRQEANDRLARNKGMIASFSRALTEGLTAQQSDDEFDAMLDRSIASIFAAGHAL